MEISTTRPDLCLPLSVRVMPITVAAGARAESQNFRFSNPDFTSATVDVALQVVAVMCRVRVVHQYGHIGIYKFGSTVPKQLVPQTTRVYARQNCICVTTALPWLRARWLKQSCHSGQLQSLHRHWQAGFPTESARGRRRSTTNTSATSKPEKARKPIRQQTRRYWCYVGQHRRRPKRAASCQYRLSCREIGKSNFCNSIEDASIGNRNSAQLTY
jgi:hypothetical protein